MGAEEEAQVLHAGYKEDGLLGVHPEPTGVDDAEDMVNVPQVLLMCLAEYDDIIDAHTGETVCTTGNEHIGSRTLEMH